MAIDTNAGAPPKVTIKRTINASRAQIYDAWTKPELMQRWFFPRNGSAKTTADLRIGGQYTHDMILPADQNVDCKPTDVVEPTAAGTKVYRHSGEYLELKPPEKLVFTWNSPSVQNTRVTVELREVGEATEITLTHELLSTAEERASHTGGWNECLSNLASYVS